MNQIQMALYDAYKYHEDQFDKGGKPYILHPVYVSTKFKEPKLKIIALLHDIIEDTEATEFELRNKGYDKDIIEAIVAITKVPDETYAEYILRLSKNKSALMVKIEDMKHNSDETRVRNISDIQYSLDKYKKWLPILEEKLNISKTD